MVTSGSVTIKDGGVSNDELANPSITVSDGINSSSVNLGETVTYSAGEGIVVGESNKTITISAEDATDTNKGIASFSTDNFLGNGWCCHNQNWRSFKC